MRDRRNLKRQFALACARNDGADPTQRHQLAGAHAKQAQARFERNPLQALAGGTAQGGGISHRRIEGEVARHGAEIGVAQFDAHRLAGVALTRQVVGKVLLRP